MIEKEMEQGDLEEMEEVANDLSNQDKEKKQTRSFWRFNVSRK